MAKVLPGKMELNWRPFAISQKRKSPLHPPEEYIREYQSISEHLSLPRFSPKGQESYGCVPSKVHFVPVSPSDGHTFQRPRLLCSDHRGQSREKREGSLPPFLSVSEKKKLKWKKKKKDDEIPGWWVIVSRPGVKRPRRDMLATSYERLFTCW